MANYTKLESTYDRENKKLVMHRPSTDYLPSYVYGMCEKAEKKENGPIEIVEFSDGKVYKVEDIKGKYDWSDIK